ncbi:UNVERIFIED_ORG: transcriptional regulator GlxA family with amidase domain [Pseudomonas lini]|uniref:AraC family transcriptional regulator n=1 Tax=Pseudomonas viciae TaxID=2505979 RepID=A0A4P7PI03_9PSED|nr:AraC family transcriptional regulator [Pseudomonas viciae]QBZ90301.1 AraC family transcriptional regulator [Pseudomonas viciae]UZE84350.1 AraC family transcriptional regulator [Pseudomonas viciae]WGO91266.1 AraC family transcriptional regulator [Pseudomonas viciae]
MAHASHTTVRAPLKPTRKTSTGGLSPWRESLVKKMILDGLSDTLEIAELAKACALSRSHFSRAFKCSTGQSPQAWIRGQRIARAKQLIRETELTLTQISLECGFCDQAHFCHIFTHSEGISPFAWRCRVSATHFSPGN